MVPVDEIIGAVPGYTQFFGLDEMGRRRDELECAFPGLVRRRIVGRSAAGADIELLSVGHGAKSVLLVGAPHPHEMVGTLTIDFFLRFLATNASAQAGAGCAWHFIQVVEPDGVRINEPWFARALTPSNYFRSFYRPPLCDQAEYTFPFTTREHSFGLMTPEASAYRTALDWVRPDLLVSLHNSEVGGAFFFTSGDDDALDKALVGCALQLGLEIDARGEYGSQSKPGRPGVFPFPDEVAQSIDEAQARGRDSHLQTGDSSVGYSERSFGTRALVPEVPYWRLRSGARISDLPDTKIANELVATYLAQFPTHDGADARARLTRALHGSMDDAVPKDVDGVREPLLSEKASSTLISLRRPAMLLALARLRGAHAIHARIALHLNAWCARMDELLEPLPLIRLVQMQAAAVWLAVARLHGDVTAP